MMNDTISRQAAINVIASMEAVGYSPYVTIGRLDALLALNRLPSAQSEHPSEIQDILDYLDTVLHPILSPEHWNVYSELYDMISMLPPAERHGQWKDIPFTARWICSNCDYISEFASFKYCPDCGARMDLEDEE